MAKTNFPEQELLERSTAEIEQLSTGAYSDFDVMTAFEILAAQDDVSKDEPKKLALLKLIWRSPEILDYYAYDQILFDLMDRVIEQENGKDFLSWALTQVILDTRLGHGFLDLSTYWNYARGLLYQGHASFFSRFLEALLAKTALPDYYLYMLIEDAARLGASDLVRELHILGKKRYGEEGQPFSVNELDSITQAPKANPLIDKEGGAAILASLSEDSFADSDEDIEIEFLLTSEDAYKNITEDSDTEALLLMVPDMIWFIFQSWEEDREGCLKRVKALKRIEKVLPELALLGDLLDDEGKLVFIFDDFGKTAGFTFDSIKSFALNPEYNIFLRSNAAKALMQIPSKAPHYRGQVIKILEELLKSQETDPKDDEIKCSFLAADVLDTDLYELKPAINQVFKQNRVDPQVVDLESYTANWKLDEPVSYATRRDKSILLECQQCTRTRFHLYEAVFYDISMRGGKTSFTPCEIFLDHPVVCPLCGAKDSYRVPFHSILRFVPSKSFGDDDSALDLLNESVYILLSEQLFMNGLTPFLFSTLRKKVIDFGLETLNALEYGEYTRVTGQFKESLQALRQFESDYPETQIGTLALAMAEHDYGDRERAKTYYQRSLALGQTSKVLSQIENPRLTVAQNGLEALRQGERSPFVYPANKFHETLLDQHPKKDREGKRH